MFPKLPRASETLLLIIPQSSELILLKVILVYLETIIWLHFFNLRLWSRLIERIALLSSPSAEHIAVEIEGLQKAVGPYPTAYGATQTSSIFPEGS